MKTKSTILTKRLTRKICNLIETKNPTIAEICYNVGIAERTFYNWKKKNAEFSRALTRARERAHEQQIKNITNTSYRGLKMLLQGYYTLITEKAINHLEDGNTEKTITVISKYIPPCTKTVLFVLTNLNKPNFSYRLHMHVNAMSRYMDDSANKKGAKILTVQEAYELGLTK